MKAFNKKKGFTIVELVIVVAVIGVLTAVLVPTFVNLVNKANQAADESLIKNLNTQLRLKEQTEGKNTNFTEALNDAAEAGYLVENLTPKSGRDIVWNQEADEFGFGDEAKDALYKFWKIYEKAEDVPTTQTYSIYAKGKAWTAVPTLTVGFDAGENPGILELNYKTTEARVVTVRTNGYSTKFSVDAPNSEVHHYGRAKEIDIVRVKKGTYNEYGDILGNINLAEGKVSVGESGSVSNVVITALRDGDDTLVTPSNSTVEVEVEGGSEVNAVIVDQSASSVSTDSVVSGQVEKVDYDADAIAFTKNGSITTIEDLGDALEGDEKVTLLKDADLTPLKRAIRNPIMLSADFDLNGYKAYVLHFGLVVNEDKVALTNGIISTAKTNYVDTKLYEVSSSDISKIDRYGLAVQADDVTLSGLTVYGGVSLGGDASSYDPSYEHCTPVNGKGNNAGNNTKVVGCTLVALDAASRYAIFSQSGSCGAVLRDTVLQGTGVNTKLINIASSIGDFGQAGDKNEITFENLKCTANPFTITSISVGGNVQFQINGDIQGTRKIVGTTGYASSDVVIEYGNGVWTMNGKLSYIVH